MPEPTSTIRARTSPPALHPRRWWTYQRERFPLAAHGSLIAVFSYSALCFSRLARGQVALPDAKTFAVAGGSSLLFFLQLRIADEFKDFEEDARFRPYRPVQRGLISLRELGAAAWLAAGVQLALALWLSPTLAPLLVLVWAYLLLMSREFFARSWLKARPITYMWTHMLIVPLIDLYVTSCDWRVAGATPPRALVWLLAVSFCNGVVLEIGRKVRAPRDEETGVQTYSVLWGRTGAAAAWMAALIATAAGAWLAARSVDFGAPASALLLALLAAAAVIAVRYLRSPISPHARSIKRLSGLWTLLMYGGIGAAPLLLRIW